jgi:hypothetical protein
MNRLSRCAVFVLLCVSLGHAACAQSLSPTFDKKPGTPKYQSRTVENVRASAAPAKPATDAPGSPCAALAASVSAAQASPERGTRYATRAVDGRNVVTSQIYDKREAAEWAYWDGGCGKN